MEDFNINIDCDFDVDIDLGSFDFLNEKSPLGTRYSKPKFHRPLARHSIKYEYAADLAKDLKLGKDTRVNVIISGNFIFGDFIEAFMVENNAKAVKMTISTLSMSQENVDSLENLLKGGYVEELNLIVSHYFFSNERHNLIPYIYEHLDFEDRFQLAVAGTHTKTCILETEGGKFIVMHGSANLRSSRNIEQFTIEENEDYYKFLDDYQDIIIDNFKTINKPLRAGKLWKAIKD